MTACDLPAVARADCVAGGYNPGMRWSRRGFLAAAGAASSACRKRQTAEPRPAGRSAAPVILVRSGWQAVNIGDIAHAPGLLRLLAQLIPEAELILWSNALEGGLGELIRKNFPQVRLVSGQTGEDGAPQTPELAEAFARADLLVHGSGAAVHRRHVDAWRRRTGKPYGVFGVTIPAADEAVSRGLDPELRDLLDAALFVFTRETRSLDNVRRAGVRRPELRFVPDAVFSFHLSNEPAARQLLAAGGLASKRFIAVVPRLRYTPYHQFRKVDWSPEEIRRRVEVNERHQGPDHAKLREVITAWVQRTGGRVLLCPEMTYQLALLEPLLYRPLPEQIRKSVVLRRAWWLPDEAASVYRHAFAVVSLECHSPILAATVDTPALYLNQPEDGIKGQMWRDLGLGRWYFEIEQASGADVAARLMEIRDHYDAAQVDLHEAVLYARRLQVDAVWFIRERLLS